MDDAVITSRDNERVRHARAIRDGRVADEIFLEGTRVSEEALRADLVISSAFYSSRLESDERGAALLSEIKRAGVTANAVSESVLDSLSDTRTPQGIVLVAVRPESNRERLERVDQTLVVVLHKLNNPANAGAVLRTAEAAGATGVIATAGTVDLFSPKGLRGAMGSAFRVPVWAGAEYAEAMSWCKEKGLRTACADVRAANNHTDIDWTIPRALILGSEAHGLTEAEIELADEAMKIPMQGSVESLNVAVSAGVVLYEAARQRELRSQ
jgi:TrmH family RNA methyltransferase